MARGVPRRASPPPVRPRSARPPGALPRWAVPLGARPGRGHGGQCDGRGGGSLRGRGRNRGGGGRGQGRRRPGGRGRRMRLVGEELQVVLAPLLRQRLGLAVDVVAEQRVHEEREVEGRGREVAREQQRVHRLPHVGDLGVAGGGVGGERLLQDLADGLRQRLFVVGRALERGPRRRGRDRTACRAPAGARRSGSRRGWRPPRRCPTSAPRRRPRPARARDTARRRREPRPARARAPASSRSRAP